MPKWKCHLPSCYTLSTGASRRAWWFVVFLLSSCRCAQDSLWVISCVLKYRIWSYHWDDHLHFLTGYFVNVFWVCCGFKDLQNGNWCNVVRASCDRLVVMIFRRRWQFQELDNPPLTIWFFIAIWLCNHIENKRKNPDKELGWHCSITSLTKVSKWGSQY